MPCTVGSELHGFYVPPSNSKVTAATPVKVVCNSNFAVKVDNSETVQCSAISSNLCFGKSILHLLYQK